MTTDIIIPLRRVRTRYNETLKELNEEWQIIHPELDDWSVIVVMGSYRKDRRPLHNSLNNLKVLVSNRWSVAKCKDYFGVANEEVLEELVEEIMGITVTFSEVEYHEETVYYTFTID